MKNFILFYWLGIIVLFALFYWDYSPFSAMVNDPQTNLTALLTSYSLPEGMIDAYRIFITENYVLVIEKACNGMIPYLFFLASILAFPANLTHKTKWALIGYFVILVINIFRIWIITQFVLHEKNNFSLAHDYMGNGLLIFADIILFILFVKTRKKEPLSIKTSSTIALNSHYLKI